MIVAMFASQILKIILCAVLFMMKNPVSDPGEIKKYYVVEKAREMPVITSYSFQIQVYASSSINS